jgi:hypothetical protein
MIVDLSEEVGAHRVDQTKIQHSKLCMNLNCSPVEQTRSQMHDKQVILSLQELQETPCAKFYYLVVNFSFLRTERDEKISWKIFNLEIARDPGIHARNINVENAGNLYPRCYVYEAQTVS